MLLVVIFIQCICRVVSDNNHIWECSIICEYFVSPIFLFLKEKEQHCVSVDWNRWWPLAEISGSEIFKPHVCTNVFFSDHYMLCLMHFMLMLCWFVPVLVNKMLFTQHLYFIYIYILSYEILQLEFLGLFLSMQ